MTEPVSHSEREELPNLVTSDIYPPRLSSRPDALWNLHTPSHGRLASATQDVTPTGSRARPSATHPPRPPTTDQPRKRGRPVGWRLGAGPYSAKTSVAGNSSIPPRKKPAQAGPAATPKRKGRPPKQRRAPRAIYDQLRPEYMPFLCEWEGCPAELQNLQTLRKHVLAVHGRSDACRWGKCGHGLRPQNFPSREELQRHVEAAHFVPLAWHVGDGPLNTNPDADVTRSMGNPKHLPEYLFDDAGHQVTPSIIHQGFESEEERKFRRRRLHRLLLQRDRNAPEEEPGSPVEEHTSIFRRV